MLYLFDQDDKFISILTEETGLVDRWFKDYQNHIIDEPFVFRVMSSSTKLKYIEAENQVAFTDRDGNLRLMRIKQVYEESSKEESVLRAICEPSYLELYDHFIEDKRITNGTAQTALNRALEGSRYIGEVTVDLGLASDNFYWIDGIGAVFKILVTWGGALKDTIKLNDKNEIIERKLWIVQRLGDDNGLIVEPDFNAESIERKTLSYVETALWGQGASLEIEDDDGAHTGGYTRYITFEDVVWSKAKGDPVDKPKGQKWVGDPQALSEFGYLHNGVRKHRFGRFSNQDYETPEELLMATWLDLQERKLKEIIHEASITAGDKKISLGDTVTILDRNYNKPIELQSQITGLEYDPLYPKEEVTIVIGKYIDMNDDPLQKDVDDLKDAVNKPRPTAPITDGSFPDIKPGTPVNVEAYGGFQAIQLYWDYDSKVYISHYEVYGSQIADFVPDSQHLLYRGRVSSFVHEVDTDQKWYYYIRAVNTRGTPSGFSQRVEAESIRVISDDILFGSILADHLQNNLDIADKLAQNTIDSINRGPMVEIEYTQQQITDTENRLLNQLNTEIGDVNASITSLNDVASNLKNRADAADDLLSQHGGNFIRIEQDISEVDGRITTTINKVEGIDNTVQSHSLELITQADLIHAKLDSLDYERDKTGIINRIESNELDIQATAKGLDLRVTKEEFEALSIGGRNLLEGSKNINLSWEDSHSSYQYLVRPQIQSILPKVKIGDTLTFSMLIESEEDTIIEAYDSNGHPDISFGRHHIEVKKGIGRVSFTATLKKGNRTGSVWYLDLYNNNNGVKFSVKEIQIEKGNKATDWRSAPEDIDNQFTVITNRVTQTETTLNAHAGLISAKAEKSEVYTKTEVNTQLNTKVDSTVYNNRVGQLDVSINEITGRVSNTETNINSLTGEVNTAKSQIADLEIEAGKIDLRVSEIQTGVSNKELTRKLGIENINRSYERDLNTSNRPLRLGTYTLTERASERVIYNNGVYSLMYSDFIPNTKDAKHYVEMDVLYEGNTQGTVYIQLLFYNKNKSEAGSNGLALNFVAGQSVTKANEWTNFSGYIDMSEQSVARKNAYYVLIRVLVRYTGVNEKAYIRDLSWKQLNSQSVTESVASITTLAGQIELKANQTSVNSLTGRMSTAETTLNLLPSQFEAVVRKDGVVASLNLSSEGLRIDGNKHHITGQTLIDNAVIGTAAIANLAVTNAKIGLLAVGTAQLQNAAITNAKIANATIDDAKIASLAVTKLLAGTLDTSKIKIRGGSAIDYTLIDGSYLESRGRFTRTWRNVTKTHDIKLRFQNGYLRARNDSEDRSLYLSDFGMSTFADGIGDGSGSRSSGTIEFFSRRFSSTYNGLTLYSSGVLGIDADTFTSVSTYTTSLESEEGLILIKPTTSKRSYDQSFIYSTSNNNGDGYIGYGTSSKASAALRFVHSGAPIIDVVDSNYATGGNTGIQAGLGYFNEIKRRGNNGNIMIAHANLLTVGDDSQGGRLASIATFNRPYSAAANVHITNQGTFGRATSARKYKKDIEPITAEVANRFFDNAVPIFYRPHNTADDNTSHSHYGYIADDVATFEPRLVTFNANGEPEGFNYDRAPALLHVKMKTELLRIDRDFYEVGIRLDKKDLEIQYLRQKLQQQDERIKQLEERVA